ncbi:achaete-scute homolog 4-like [Gigantopelta aegis]|uniref:achaete-scute homolog 4-like n=1 Tax=Gigantopelta aegis TaxID=1735272 RepID=UPI001B8891C0|nr:achaete-scute homolog 4-like [Gigantopelta aegis]
MHHYHRGGFTDTVRISSPTCEDLGIPTEDEDLVFSFCRQRKIQNPGLHINGLRYEVDKANPFSNFSMIPLPAHFLIEPGLEPAFIRKRNERERERVRCVNDGYEKLKDHLPIENKDRRISKVETLRTAIRYIKHLQALLEESDIHGGQISENGSSKKRKLDSVEKSIEQTGKMYDRKEIR